MSFLRDQRKGVGAQIGIIFFWVFMVGVVAGVLAPHLQNMLHLPERHDGLFMALGAALGLCIGAYAAFGSSRLAVLLAFPAILFGILPF